PSRQAAVIVARGNHARGDLPEEPGSLEFLALRDGQLTNIATVAPNGGHGFGPRHLDFHPDGRWAAVSMERQNELQVFEMLADRFAPAPAHRVTTLDRPAHAGHDQLSGALHFHPDGRTLYVINRHDSSVYGDGREPADAASNNVAVYRFDAATGGPKLIQHIATESVHVRTFSLDASATLLVTASILPALWRHDGVVETVPARLTFFRIASDGRLSLAAVRDMGGDRAAMFWSHLNGSM
ncbi:MAG: beta-propeller fold lactonase family protein, partial [Rubrivivax sp.]